MEQKHSGLGIASFIISLLTGLLVFLLMAMLVVIEKSTPGGIDEKSVGAVVTGLFILAMLIGDFVALGLGIGGLIQKERKKIFAILGTTFSAATIAGMIFLIIIGNKM